MEAVRVFSRARQTVRNALLLFALFLAGTTSARHAAAQTATRADFIGQWVGTFKEGGKAIEVTATLRSDSTYVLAGAEVPDQETGRWYLTGALLWFADPANAGKVVTDTTYKDGGVWITTQKTEPMARLVVFQGQRLLVPVDADTDPSVVFKRVDPAAP